MDGCPNGFRAEKEGFVVVGKVEDRTWSKEDAQVFYAEHKDQPFFDTLVAFMSSGPIVQLCLEKVHQTVRSSCSFCIDQLRCFR